MYKFNVRIGNNSYFTKANNQMQAVHNVLRRIKYVELDKDITIIRGKRK